MKSLRKLYWRPRDQVSQSSMVIARGKLQDIMGVMVKALLQALQEEANCLSRRDMELRNLDREKGYEITGV